MAKGIEQLIILINKFIFNFSAMVISIACWFPAIIDPYLPHITGEGDSQFPTEIHAS